MLLGSVNAHIVKSKIYLRLRAITMMGKGSEISQNRLPTSLCGRRRYTRGAITMMPEGPEVRSLTDSLRYNLCGSSQHSLTGANLLSGRYQKSDPQGWDTLAEHCGDDFVVDTIASKGKFIFMTFPKQQVTLWSTLGE